MFFLNRKNINDAVEECRRTPGAVLLDVREAEEFRAGHIPGAANIPLRQIGALRLSVEKPLFVYCLRGARSRQAANKLKKMGYTAKSIGGIMGYQGQLER